ncbi:hypothetical protein ACH49_01340 [Streptomyces leeuwenhoekii]|uniref:Uncharacterized protein n=1 Tax=Streptomyces leeuwenhoekii TaxID=1437453 RepID=A0ABR5I5D9_STRLW|nr:hypothetical protein [Streptomyces leeuwenhoekii]KMS81803.1 hypothetical protein ACH49_01340 [Streptomyces leeuwenhoekii]
MSAVEKAAREAVEAADNAEQLKLIAAVLQAQQILSQQQPQGPAPVRQEFDAKKWIVVGGVCIAGGLVASLFAVVVAIGAMSVGILALVLRSMWSDYQKGR